MVNQRDNFLHKLSCFYIANHDVIVVEVLQIRNMIRNHNLAQRILDASWDKFIQLLSYKVVKELANIEFRRIEDQVLANAVIISILNALFHRLLDAKTYGYMDTLPKNIL